MDAGNQEDQLIVVKKWKWHTPSRANILNCINDALKQVGFEDLLNSECVLRVENFPVLVGGDTDGAAVKVAETG